MSSTSSLNSISEDEESIPLDGHDKDMTCVAKIDPTTPMGRAAVIQSLLTVEDTEQEAIQGWENEKKGGAAAGGKSCTTWKKEISSSSKTARARNDDGGQTSTVASGTMTLAGQPGQTTPVNDDEKKAQTISHSTTRRVSLPKANTIRVELDKLACCRSISYNRQIYNLSKQ
jgi:hypothetical protein